MRSETFFGNLRGSFPEKFKSLKRSRQVSLLLGPSILEHVGAGPSIRGHPIDLGVGHKSSRVFSSCSRINGVGSSSRIVFNTNALRNVH